MQNVEFSLSYQKKGKVKIKNNFSQQRVVKIATFSSSKVVAFLSTYEFRPEIHRRLNRNFQYTNPLQNIVANLCGNKLSSEKYGKIFLLNLESLSPKKMNEKLLNIISRKLNVGFFSFLIGT